MVYTWTNTGSSIIADSTQISTTAIVCTADTFNLNVRDSGSGCSIDSAIVVSILPKPAAVTTVNPDLICLGPMPSFVLVLLVPTQVVQVRNRYVGQALKAHITKYLSGLIDTKEADLVER